MHEVLALIVYYVTFVFDLVGVLLVVWGGLFAVWSILIKAFSKTKKDSRHMEKMYRQAFASKMILALEFFLAVDIITTVASPTWDTLGKLGALVVIRTVLTYFLNREIRENAYAERA